MVEQVDNMGDVVARCSMLAWTRSVAIGKC
jgi:hypothetical protein